MCEPEEVLVPALPETACIERGYITSQQVYNLLNAEEGQPALYDPYYILILDCRSAERCVLNVCTRVMTGDNGVHQKHNKASEGTSFNLTNLNQLQKLTVIKFDRNL